jgi:hypothetical protein
MVLGSALLLPVFLSAVIVFVASSIMHMVLPYHRSDYKKLPDEDGALAALRKSPLARGLYVFPYCTHQDMKSDVVREKRKQGPVGFLTVIPSGDMAMGKFLGQWFVFCLLVSFFVAYLAAHTIAPGTNYRAVFRIVGTAAFLAYSLGNLPNGIWRGYPWSNTLKDIFDGLIYALLTAGTFGWLWPK